MSSLHPKKVGLIWDRKKGTTKLRLKNCFKISTNSFQSCRRINGEIFRRSWTRLLMITSTWAPIWRTFCLPIATWEPVWTSLCLARRSTSQIFWKFFPRSHVSERSCQSISYSSIQQSDWFTKKRRNSLQRRHRMLSMPTAKNVNHRPKLRQIWTLRLKLGWRLRKCQV